MSLKYLLSIPLILLSISSVELLGEESGGAMKHLENIKEIITGGLSPKKDETPIKTKKEDKNSVKRSLDKQRTIE